MTFFRRLAPWLGGLAWFVGAGCQVEPSPVAPSVPPAVEKSGIGIPSGWLSTPRLFTTGTRIESIAATPSRMLGSTLGEAPSKLVQITETGAIQPFAPGFTAPSDVACPLEVAAGVGAFGEDAVLAGCGSDVWLLAQDGSTATVLASLPAEDGDITGLAFDPTGGFGYRLLVLARTGAVHQVDAAGRVTRVGAVGPGASGPSVASARFGRFAGQLLVAFPAASEVRALDSAGNVSFVLRWPGVVGAFAVPDAPCAFGATGGALFVATENAQVYRYPLADLAPRGGAVLLTSIYRSGSGIATAVAGICTTRAFGRSMGRERAAGFVRRPAVLPVRIEIMPGVANKVILLGSTSLIPVGLLASTGFVPASLNGGEVTFAGAYPVTRGRARLGTYADLNGDGQLDILLQFRAAEMQLAQGSATLVFEGTAIEGDRVRGSGRVLVLAP